MKRALLAGLALAALAGCGVQPVPSVEPGPLPSSAVRVNPAASGTGLVQEALRKAEEAVSRVHSFPQVTNPVWVGEADSEEWWGLFEGSTAELDDQIWLSPSSNSPAFTLLHEIGHWLDEEYLHVSGLSGKPSRFPAETAAFWEAVSGTGLLPVWEGCAKNCTEQAAREDSAYLADPVEVFARAYSQWVASESPSLTKALRSEELVGHHWSVAEFAPIAAALDTLFRAASLR